MKTVLHTCFRAAASLALLTLALAGLSAPAGAKTKVCYSNDYDFDGDRYARIGAPSTNKTVDDTDLRCPSGYVDRATDCNDFNAAVHPRTREIGFNGTDDNCNGLVDEPTFTYRADGINNGTNSFTISVHLNHPDIREAARNGTLYVKVRRFRLTLSDTSDGALTAVTAYPPFYNTAQIVVGGGRVLSGTVWAASLFFYRREGGSHVNIGPNGDLAGDGSNELVDTERYYTMTDSSVATVHNRFLLVMKGLAEYNASQLGEVGYAGSDARDGRRYSADANEKWCSEFYVWVAKSFVADVSGTTVEDVKDFFRDHSALMSAREVPVGDPGDYLSLDTDQDGDPNHSAMLLAYDTLTGNVWTLEGNSGNEVKIKSRVADWALPLPAGKDAPVFNRLGHIKSSMWR